MQKIKKKIKQKNPSIKYQTLNSGRGLHSLTLEMCKAILSALFKIYKADFIGFI